jgi:hypothetical protein
MTNKIDESSQTVQTHLGIIQNVISRMAANSSSCKSWCITLVAAILVVIADKNNSKLALIAYIPTFLFLLLDAHYLALEKGFRISYNAFVSKLHKGELASEDFYVISPKGNIFLMTLQSMGSFSIWPFYLTLAAMIFIGMKVLFK